ncbi:hypothetical protein C2S53_019964 [Perilla frutescens var. hirtella]|uniref:TF-B3 domain-containing protein n=1 Tax=Perilla frutescens var. hirtella TaxID=608512 RepID=A0AAD4ISY5_PERFH|nr:hypothetical protein C2S53_019964 [Perilla frutescens var. hirtella]
MEYPMAYLKPIFYKMVENDGPTQSLCLPYQFYMDNTETMPPVVRLIFKSDKYWTCDLKQAEERTECFSLTKGWKEFASAASLQPSEVLMFYQVGKNSYVVSIYLNVMVQRMNHPAP